MIVKHIKGFFALIVLLIPFAIVGALDAQAQADNVRFFWTAPAERIDGEPLPASEILRTHIICDDNQIAVVTGAAVEAFGSLPAGEHNCWGVVYATADSIGGGEIASVPSESIVAVVPVKYQKPKTATGFGFSLN